MEIEIVTLTATWFTVIDDQEFADRELGDAARTVRERIQSGKSIDVTEESSGTQRRQASVRRMAVFNPAHVVAVVETRRVPPRRDDEAMTRAARTSRRSPGI